MKKTWILFGIELIVLAVMNVLHITVPENSIWLGIVLVGSGLVCFVMEMRQSCRTGMLKAGFITGFLCRSMLLFFDVYGRNIALLPFAGADTDSTFIMAQNMAVTGKVTVSLSSLYNGTMGLLFGIVGCERIIPQYLNLLCGMTAVYVFMKTLDLLECKDIMHKMLVLVFCLFPTYMLSNILLLREAFMVFFLSVSLYWFVKWWKQGKVKRFVLACVPAVLAAAFHVGMAAVLVGYLIAFMLWDPQEEKFRISGRTWFCVIVIAAAAVAVGFNLEYILHGKLWIFKENGLAGAVERLLTVTEGGAADYQVGLLFSNPYLSLILNAPVRMLYFLGGPFPWAWNSAYHIAAFVFSGLIYIYMLIFVISKIRYMDKKTRGLAVILLTGVLCFLFIFGWSVTNYGTALRHRDKYLPVFLLLMALATSIRKKYLIRLDDASEYEDTGNWNKMEALLHKYGVKPIVGVIPNNRDPKLCIYEKEKGFWDKIRKWNEDGWTIALHGYDHVYVTEEGGLNPVNKRSEFAGLVLEQQEMKIEKGVKQMQEQGITPTVFFAPSHTFDENTLKALEKKSDIRIISDTVAHDVYYANGFWYLPQQSGRVRELPFKTVTFCYHPNEMQEKDFMELETFLAEHKVGCMQDVAFTKRKMGFYDKLLKKLYFARR